MLRWGSGDRGVKGLVERCIPWGWGSSEEEDRGEGRRPSWARVSLCLLAARNLGYPMRNSTEQHLFLTHKTNLEVEGSGLAWKPRSQGGCRLFLGCRLWQEGEGGPQAGS